LLAAHDAGGANLLCSWLRRHRHEHEVSLLLGGPARSIFAATIRDIAPLPALPRLEAFDLVLCGSSADADLERHVVRGARAAGTRSAVWLEHWFNFRKRFELAGELVLPDELWVADEHAERLARTELPGPPVILKGNPHLEDGVAEIAEIAARNGSREPGEHILYVSAGTSIGARWVTGDPLGWGYDELDILRRYLEHLIRASPAPAGVRLRPHPAEPLHAFASLVTELGSRLPVSLSPGGSIEQDCAWADTVVGTNTMAMVMALKAGRRVVSVIPRDGAPLTLPFEEIERLYLD
jgi:hypothetical protein